MTENGQSCGQTIQMTKKIAYALIRFQVQLWYLQIMSLVRLDFVGWNFPSNQVLHMHISLIPYYMLLFQDEEVDWENQDGREESCPLLRTNSNLQPCWRFSFWFSKIKYKNSYICHWHVAPGFNLTYSSIFYTSLRCFWASFLHGIVESLDCTSLASKQKKSIGGSDIADSVSMSSANWMAVKLKIISQVGSQELATWQQHQHDDVAVRSICFYFMYGLDMWNNPGWLLPVWSLTIHFDAFWIKYEGSLHWWAIVPVGFIFL